ncbi:uncharacterized protein LOC114239883 [Bombyx mandarina]|uniref:Uncharacterized protein LOC114239883 n=1 Tax=Bombyx mandarina TaxID=7092 RepID=A0A6J2J9Y1_BOMMA|nr:uncharacterized protein LOC114239883 [Bombyx mandarina]
MKSNQARHLKIKHVKAFKQWQETSKVNRTVKPQSSGRRGWIQDYVKKIGDGKYECKICSAILRMPSGLYGNMKRHFKRKHPIIYEEEMKIFSEQSKIEDVVEYVVEYIDDDDDDAISMNSDELLSAIKGEVQKEINVNNRLD